MKSNQEPMLIYPEFEIGDIVYVIIDSNQLPHIVNAITVLPGKVLSYGVDSIMGSSSYYAYELSREKEKSLHFLKLDIEMNQE